MGEASKSKKGERLNWEQACRVLGCGKTHFYHLVNSGSLPAYRSGGKRGLWVWERDCRELITLVVEEEILSLVNFASSDYLSNQEGPEC